MVTDQQDLEALAVDFYSNLFTAQPNLEPEQIVRHMPHRVTAKHLGRMVLRQVSISIIGILLDRVLLGRF